MVMLLVLKKPMSLMQNRIINLIHTLVVLTLIDLLRMYIDIGQVLSTATTLAILKSIKKVYTFVKFYILIFKIKTNIHFSRLAKYKCFNRLKMEKKFSYRNFETLT